MDKFLNTLRVLFIGWLLTVSFLSYGQEGRWINGRVLIFPDSIFVGQFRLDTHVDKEIISIKKGNRILAFPPKDVIYAEGELDGEYRKWRTETFEQEHSNFAVHLLMEEVYADENYLLFRKNMAYIKWSPYADIVCDGLAFDSYKHIVNSDALLLKKKDSDKMAVINRPNAWNASKYMINMKMLAAYLDMEKKSLKAMVKENDLKLDRLENIVSLFMIIGNHQHHLTMTH